ncbi:hypothetical protein NQ314_000914 [Rhamnusium bicolor]|uniref:Homeobox domain-containing protein n=1 Tax=Rhamnusium bicolor TaxID=1586634 RepID=A0AAV8ZU03_9CUCU|nr:hypothetical protein NQ314_000914 [Rhamnusium bicolor]
MTSVKIWFQNRRMKWKRSKKAHQEAKSSKEGDSSKSAQTSNSSQNNFKSCPSISSQGSTESPVPIIENNQNEIRKMHESESLYRPYVV